MLLFLGPAFTFALYHAAQYDPGQVYGVAFSGDGSKLLVFRVRVSAIAPFEPTFREIQVWDLASGRLIRTVITGRGPVSATLDGKQLFDRSDDGRVRFLNSDTLEMLEEWRLPEGLGQIRNLMVADRLLVVNSQASDVTVRATVLFKRRVVRQWSDSHEVRATLSSDGRRVFVSSADAQNASWTTQVFEVRGGLVSERPILTLNARVIAVSPQGDKALVDRGASTLVIHDLPAGSERSWTPSPRWGQPWIIYFTADGELLRSIHDNSVSAAVSATSGAVVSEQQLARAGRLEVYSVSPDERWIASTSDYSTAKIWDLATGKVVARFPDHRTVRVGLAAVYLAWCLIWVASGVRSAPPRPWLDAVLILGVLLAVCMTYAATRPIWAVDRAAVAVSLALLTSLLGLLVVWWIHGRLRWSLRLGGAVAGAAAIVAGLLASGHREDPGAWNVILGSITYIAGLALLLKSWRWGGITMARRNEAAGAALVSSGDARWQAPLKDFLLVIASLSLLLAVMRFAVPGMRDRFTLAYVTVIGGTLAATVFVSAWAALSPRRIWPVFVAACVTAAGGSAAHLLFGARSPDPWWWCETLHGGAAAAVFLTLSIFRLHGYRLVKTSYVVRQDAIGEALIDEKTLPGV